MVQCEKKARTGRKAEIQVLKVVRRYDDEFFKIFTLFQILLFERPSATIAMDHCSDEMTLTMIDVINILKERFQFSATVKDFLIDQ